MAKGNMKNIDVIETPNGSFDLLLDDTFILNMSRVEVEELYFQLGAAMHDQDMAWEEARAAV